MTFQNGTIIVVTLRVCSLTCLLCRSMLFQCSEQYVVVVVHYTKKVNLAPSES